jgi:hypothetical protein
MLTYCPAAGVAYALLLSRGMFDDELMTSSGFILVSTSSGFPILRRDMQSPGQGQKLATKIPTIVW